MTGHVLITGCSTGIGAAAARVFANAGWRVTATMRDTAAGEALKQVDGVTLARLDVTQPETIAATLKDALDREGRVDVLVNNAGYGLFNAFETSTPQQVERQFATNTLGVMNMIRAVLPAMRAQRAGVVINVTSVGGLTTMPFNSVYHATKYAVDGFSEALRYELDPFGVTVKVVAPGGVATEFATSAVSELRPADLGDYGPAIGKVQAAFAGRRDNYSSAEAIAQVILKAASDGSPQLRYVAGPDAEMLLKMRESLSDEAYIAALAGRFGL